MLVDAVKRFWTRSIQRQLILGIALVHAILMTIFVYDLVERQRGFLSQQLVAQTQSLTETLAANSVSWVLANDVIGLEEVILSQSGYPGLEFAMVLSLDGRVLAHIDANAVGRFATDETSKKLIGAPATIQLLQTNINLVDVAAPIMVNERQIGWARVGISGEKVTEGLQVITRDGVLYTIIAIIVGTLFAFFMARGITAGLHKLVLVAASIREGTKRRAKLDREDELGQLANDFNLMLDEIDRNSRSRLMLEQEIRSQRDQLEGQVLERTHELEEARDEALRATAAKTEFLSRMSHELRTPLNAVLGFGHILTVILKDNEEAKKQANKIVVAGNHLLVLIEEIMDLSRIETGQIEVNLEPVELQQVINESVSFIRPLAEEHRVSLDIQNCDFVLYADETRLKEIILNLLSNAVKYNKNGGNTSLSCGEEAGFIKISVEDTGIGFSDEQRKMLFEPFSRLGAEYTGIQGTGIGMTIVKSLLELMGGKIVVESTPGEGSRFDIYIPQHQVDKVI